MALMNHQTLTHPGLLVASLALLLTISCSTAPAVRPARRVATLHPEPTEHRQDEDAERRNRAERKRWIRDMHRTAPGVSWRDVERENGLRRQEERARQLASGRGALPVFPKWKERGSRNLAGRMHATALSSLVGSELVAGSSLGGVWRGSLEGEGWTPIGNNLFGGSHGLAISPGSPEIITAITDGGLISYTLDGGATWHTPRGLPASISFCRRVVVDPSSTRRLYLMLRRNSSWRLYRSLDGGKSYAQVRALGTSPGDIWIDRVEGGAVYLLEGTSFLRSSDGGDTWNPLGTIPVLAPQAVVLAGSEDGAPMFYATVRIGGQWKLYRSNGGSAWGYRSDINDYWETLAASITNRNLVFHGGVEVWRSTNGGLNFAKINGWGEYYGDPVSKLHADIPGIDMVWTQGQEITFISTDGGLYRSDDGGLTVRNISLEGLGVSQYYDTFTSKNNPELVLAGAQDQGYQRSSGQAKNGGPLPFEQIISGDYGHLTSSDGSHNWVYSVYPGFVLVQRGEANPRLVAYLDFPEGETLQWMPTVLADPDNARAFYLCCTRLWKYELIGSDWVMEQLPHDFTQSGGSTLTALSIAPSDHNRRIAVTDSGVIWTTNNAGASWILSPDNGPQSHYFYGSALIHSPDDPLTAYLGGSGYSGPAVYRTTDGGMNWEPVGEGLPSTLVYDLAFEQSDESRVTQEIYRTGVHVIYAATEAGPFRLDPSSATWKDISSGEAPLTLYWSVEAVPSAGVVRFGTYGRGIWDYKVHGVFGE